MNCPYCTHEMIKGYIYGDRYALKWLPSDKKLFGGIFAVGSEKLSSNSFVGRQKVKAYKCSNCNKLIIDMNDTN